MSEPTRGRASPPVRPNLWADRLASYAFAVEASIGRNPMRYLLARRFGADDPSRALTMLFVLEPEVLAGTYIRIREDRAAGACEVRTYLPTMARPVTVAEALLFDCLPLTDVGYVDLMAWPHPGLRPEPPEGPSTRGYRYDRAPVLRVREDIDPERSAVARRVLYRDGQETRRWEVAEWGRDGQETLPSRIRVTRPRTGHETRFTRTGPAVAVPPAVFDGEPEILRDRIEELLAPTRRPS
ncbi:hypothetical protein [Actinomadura sp. NEAU-AAG7]|uniref:hypothetical protein n=1 Tax=Actinomadura sp. NEAU-AAG7 TaxID=2839640 RepID=UPI001BE3F1AA|nr:hypothetical protein [Actinomadura sp. NEAU-AAG7]MBT2212766.1 hypothetical protein [Actinomadura sp. NEAU-AAG7]